MRCAVVAGKELALGVVDRKGHPCVRHLVRFLAENRANALDVGPPSIEFPRKGHCFVGQSAILCALHEDGRERCRGKRRKEGCGRSSKCGTLRYTTNDTRPATHGVRPGASE